MLAGSLALKALNQGRQSNWEHKLTVILPPLLIIFTPIIMRVEKGDAWLEAERLPALILFEAFSGVQFLLALAMSKAMSVAKGMR